MTKQRKQKKQNTVTKKTNKPTPSSLRDYGHVKQIEELQAEIMEERRQFEKLFQEAPSPMAITRISDGAIYAVNLAFEELFGYQADLIVGATTVEIGLYGDNKQCNKLSEQVKKLGGIAKNLLLQLRSQAGENLSVLASATQLKFDGEECLLTIFQNVTELLDKAEALQISEQRYHALHDAFPFAIHRYQLLENNSLIFVGANAAADVLFGRDHSCLIGKRIEEAFPEIADTSLPERYRKVIHDDEVWKEQGSPYKSGIESGTVEITAFKTGPDTIAVQFCNQTAQLRLEEIVLNITKGTSAAIGDDFFSLFAEYLCRSLQVDFAMIGERIGDNADTIATISVFGDGKIIPNFSYDLKGTPCLHAIIERSVCCYTDKTHEAFPDGIFLTEMGIQGYAGIPLISTQGDVLGILAVMTRTPLKNADLIESVLKIFAKRAAAELQRRCDEEFLRLARFSIENASEAIFWYDLSGRYLYVNEAGRRALGYSLDELQLMHVFDIDPHTTEESWKNMMETLRRKGSVHHESSLHSKFGRELPVEVRTNLRRYAGKEYIFSFVHDISERKRADEIIAAEKERLTVTLRSINDGVITTDVNGNIVLINRVAEYLTGWRQSQALGRSIKEIFQCLQDKSRIPYELPFLEAAGADHFRSLPNRLILVTRDRRERMISAYAAPIRDHENILSGTVLVFRDITEQIRLEEDILRNEKLESIGVLAGGIAHDFNNLLTGILGNLSLTHMLMNPHDRLAHKIEEAIKAAERAKDLAAQLLTFSKGGAPIKKTLSIRQIIMDSASFSLRGSNVRCTFDMPANLLPVDVDPGQINQVINNLIINADQAMPEGGMVRIHAENIKINEHSSLPLRPGSYVRVSVSDEGVGIPANLLPKIFDPYFTTKTRGSGLGTSTVYSIIKRHNGLISVQSALGRGSTFTIYLPASEQPSGLEEQQPAEMLFRGSGRILVMDDEDIIRKIAGEILSYLGYTPVLCSDGAEALAMYRQAAERNEPFDAVIMDLTIPGGMGGKELIRHLLLFDPNVKAIVSSGYSNDPILAFFHEFGFQGVILKPYRAEDVSKVLYEVLQKKDSVNVPDMHQSSSKS
jgi:PAS domain S-box-containing protein